MDTASGSHASAAQRAELAAIGGLENLQRYLAEDFAMGNLMRKQGRKVVLSRCIISHFIGNDGFVRNWKHRLRWAREYPAFAADQVFGGGGAFHEEQRRSPWRCGVAAPAAWGLALTGLIFRAWAQWATAIWVLDDPLVARYWWLLPVEDLASFVTWVLGFFGSTIVWHGRKLALARDGRFNDV